MVGVVILPTHFIINVLKNWRKSFVAKQMRAKHTASFSEPDFRPEFKLKPEPRIKNTFFYAVNQTFHQNQCNCRANKTA